MSDDVFFKIFDEMYKADPRFYQRIMKTEGEEERPVRQKLDEWLIRRNLRKLSEPRLQQKKKKPSQIDIQKLLQKDYNEQKNDVQKKQQPRRQQQIFQIQL